MQLCFQSRELMHFLIQNKVGFTFIFQISMKSEPSGKNLLRLQSSFRNPCIPKSRFAERIHSNQPASFEQQQKLLHTQPDHSYEEIHPKKMSIIQDPRYSRFTFGKLILIEKNLLIVAMLEMFIGMLNVQAQSLEKQNQCTQYLLTVMDMTTVVIIILLVIRKFLSLQLQADQKIIYLPRDYQNFKYGILGLAYFYKSTMAHLLWQIMLALPHPTRILNDCYYFLYSQRYQTYMKYSVNDFLSVLMMLKSIIIIRSAVSLTIFASPRAGRICRQSGLQHDFFFSIKCLQKDHPLMLSTVFFSFTCVLFGYGIRVSEGRLSSLNSIGQNGFQSYANCFWFALMTMNTIGYGQYYPVTLIGRTLAIILSIIGVVLNSMLVVALTQYLKMKSGQARSLTTLQRLQQHKQLQKESSQAFAQTIKITKLLSSSCLDPLVTQKLKPSLIDLKRKVDRAKQRLIKVKAIIPAQDISQQMIRSFEVIRDSFKEIDKFQRKMKEKIQLIAKHKKGQQQQLRRSFIQEISKMPNIKDAIKMTPVSKTNSRVSSLDSSIQ